MGWWIGTVVYAALYLLATGLVHVTGRRGQNGLKHLMVGTAVFCCWYMWSIFYWAQMYPQVNPVLKEHEGDDKTPEEL